MKSGALIIFVKTPGLSPIKTRLAADIGAAKAAAFYLHAILRTELLAKEAMSRCPGLSVYWAVAEQAAVGHDLWQSFSNLWQGEGTLGERLSHIYDQAISQHDFVCFMGADSPHLSADTLCDGVLKSSLCKDFVMGPADDGGFYFFGGSLPIPKELWLRVRYSEGRTAADLRESLSALGEFELLPSTFDIDTGEDFRKYQAALES